MVMITGRTRGGVEWTPQCAVAIDGRKCIGCGRCYKVCPREVLDLVERGEELMADIDEDDLDDDQMMVMSLKNAADCIGCGSCGRVCPKGCYSYASAEA
ncbi:MAG: ferredoxin III, nif-specific [Rhodocyclales bacterium]|nr:ferredoxin III, nif-specific [Rhodocyclales bacterium]